MKRSISRKVSSMTNAYHFHTRCNSSNPDGRNSYPTRVLSKVRGLTLLLRLGTLWRCGDVILLEVPPLASDAFLTTLHLLLENVLQTVDHFEIPCLGAPFSWLEKPRNRMGRDLDCMAETDQWNPIRTSAVQYISPPMGLLGFSNRETGVPRQGISK